MHTGNISLQSIFMVLLFVSSIGVARTDNSGISDEQMQQMMQGAQKMQECMANIDQAALQKLTEKSQEMQKELQALCSAGKRDEAQNRAIEYGKEIENSNEMQEMKKCGEMAQQMMQQMPAIPGSNSGNAQHVCDVIN